MPAGHLAPSFENLGLSDIKGPGGLKPIVLPCPPPGYLFLSMRVWYLLWGFGWSALLNLS